MSILKDLQPQAVYHWFEEIAAIPHGSGNTDAISDFCVAFARARKLEAQKDGANNVIIVKPASKGYETHPTVILQGHLDMVAEKTEDSDFDFLHDGLKLRVDGDWVSAEGTTLGADDGIAVAMILAILDDDAIAHPRIEALLTSDEETGLNGALALDASPLQGRTMLNLDSEREGTFVLGCAGGITAHGKIPVSFEPCKGEAVSITVSGLRGGHSGAAIHARANAWKLLSEALSFLPEYRLVSLDGGTKHNAIPRSCTAVVFAKNAAAAIAEAEAKLRAENPKETDLRVNCKPVQADCAMTVASSKAIAAFLQDVPNGVWEMNPDFPKLVLTSSNLAVIRTEGDTVCVTISIRSGREGGCDAQLARITQAMEAAGGSVETDGAYPAWYYRKDSPLCALMSQVYTELNGEVPKLYVTHGGLECGVLCEKLPGLDVVAFGPNVEKIHTPDERMSISSVARSWTYLLEVLKRL